MKKKSNKKVQKILASALAASSLLIPAAAFATNYSIDGGATYNSGVATGGDTPQMIIKDDGATTQDSGTWNKSAGDTVTMSGGTLDVSGYDGSTSALTNGIIQATGGVITVSGGTFTVGATSSIKDVSITINSGTTLVNNGYINSPYNEGAYGTTIEEGATLRTIGLNTWDTEYATKGFDGYVTNEGTVQLEGDKHRVMINQNATGAYKGEVDLLGDVQISNMEVKADTLDLNGNTLTYSWGISNSIVDVTNLKSSTDGGKISGAGSTADALFIGRNGETPTTNDIRGITFENFNGIVGTRGNVIIDAEKNTVGGSGFYENYGNLYVTGGTSSDYADSISKIQGNGGKTYFGNGTDAAYINNTGTLGQETYVQNNATLRTSADLIGENGLTGYSGSTIELNGGTLAANHRIRGFYNEDKSDIHVIADTVSNAQIAARTLAIDSGKTLTNNNLLYIEGGATTVASTIAGNINGTDGIIRIGDHLNETPTTFANVTMNGTVTNQTVSVHDGSELGINSSTLAGTSAVEVKAGGTINTIDNATTDYSSKISLGQNAIVKGDIDYTNALADVYGISEGTTAITYAMANVIDAADPLEGGMKELQVTANGVTVNKDANFAWYNSDSKGLALVSSGNADGKIKLKVAGTGIDGAVDGTDDGTPSTVTYNLTADDTFNGDQAIENADFTIQGSGTGSTDKTLTLAKDLKVGDATKTSKLTIDNAKIAGTKDLIIESGSTGIIKDSEIGVYIRNHGILNSDPTTYKGGIANYIGATATITGDTFTGIDRTGENGGAIWNEEGGTLTLNGVTFTGNTGANGGAIYNQGTTTINGGTFTNNTATASGGAIYSKADLTINSTTAEGAVTFTGNTANGAANDIRMLGTNDTTRVTLYLNAKDDTNKISLAGGVDGQYYDVNINGAAGNAGTVEVAGIKGAKTTTINAGTVSNSGLINSDVDIKTGAKLTTAGVDDTTTPTSGLNGVTTIADGGKLSLTGGTVNKNINYDGSTGSFTGAVELSNDVSVADSLYVYSNTLDLQGNTLTLGNGVDVNACYLTTTANGTITGGTNSIVAIGFQGLTNNDITNATINVDKIYLYGDVAADTSKLTSNAAAIFVADGSTATLTSSTGANANDYRTDTSSSTAGVIIAETMSNTGAFTNNKLTINAKDASDNDITFTTDANKLATTDAVDNKGTLVLTGAGTPGHLGADITGTGALQIGDGTTIAKVSTNGHNITQSTGGITISGITSDYRNEFFVNAGDTVTGNVSVGENAYYNVYGSQVGNVTLTQNHSGVYLQDNTSSITGNVISDNGGTISLYAKDTPASLLSQISGDIKGSGTSNGSYVIGVASNSATGNLVTIDKAIAGATGIKVDYDSNAKITDVAYESTSAGITVGHDSVLTLDNTKDDGTATVGSAISAKSGTYTLNIENTGATAGTTQINGAITGADDVNVKSGTINFNVDVTSNTLVVDAGSTLNVASGKTASGDLTNSGTVNNSGILSGDIANKTGASLTTATTGITTTNPVLNDGTVTFNDTGATAQIAQSIAKETSGGGIVEIAGGAATVFNLKSGETLTDNSLKLSSGIFDATNMTTSGNLDLTATGLNIPLIANGGTLSVQDGLMGAINLGTVDTTTAGLNVIIDAQFTTGTQDASGITGSSDIITGAVTTAANKIHVSDIKITADPIATEFKTQIADAASAGNVDLTATTLTGLSAGAGDILLKYDNSTGFLTGGHSTLKDAIISTIPTKMYVVGDGNLSTAGNLTMNGNSLSVTAADKTIQGGNNTVSLANSAQTLSISGGTGTATIQGFATAIDNAVGGTVNLDNVTMTGNTTDVNNANPGNLNLSGTNSINKITGNGTTTVKSGTTTINTSLAQDTINVGDASVPSDGALVNDGTAQATNLNVNTAGSTYTNNAGKTTTLTGKLTNKGTVANNGTLSADTLDNQKTISGTGNMTLANGGSNAGAGASITQNNITLNGSTFNNDAAMTANGLLTNKGTLNNNSTLSANTLDNDSVIAGTGDLTVVAGGASDGIIAQATVELTGGNFDNNANITTTGAFTTGANLDNDATIKAEGTFTNTGVITTANDTGVLEIAAGGSSSGVITQSIIKLSGVSPIAFNNTADMTATTAMENASALSNSAKITAKKFTNTGAITGTGDLEVGLDGGSSSASIQQSTVEFKGGNFANTADITTTGTIKNAAALANSATITSGGAFTNTGTVSGAGTLIAQNGGSSSGAGTITQATIQLTGGTFDNDVDMTATTLLDIDGATTKLTNDATVIAAKLENDGIIDQSTAGTLKIAGAGSYNKGSITQSLVEVTGGDFTNDTAGKIYAAASGTTTFQNDAGATATNKGDIGTSTNPITTLVNKGTKFTNDTTGNIYATNVDNDTVMENYNSITATTVDNDGTYSNSGAGSKLLATTINNNAGSFTNDGKVGDVGALVTTLNNSATFTNNATGVVLATTIDNKASGTFTNSGKVGTSADPVKTITNNGISFTNNATGAIVANTINNNTNMENKKGGSIDSIDYTNASGAKLTNNGTVSSTGTFTNTIGAIVDNNGTEGEGTLNVVDGSNAGTITQGDLTIAAGNTGFDNTSTLNTEHALTISGTLNDNGGTINAINSTNNSLFDNEGTFNANNSNTNADNVVNNGTANLTASNFIVGYQAGDIKGTINIKGTTPADTTNLDVQGVKPDITGNINVGSITDKATLNLKAGNIKEAAILNIASNSVLNVDNSANPVAQTSVVVDGANDSYLGDITLKAGDITMKDIQVATDSVSTTAGGTKPYYEQTGGNLKLENATLTMTDASRISGGNINVDDTSVFNSQKNAFTVNTLQNSGLINAINNGYEHYGINNLVVGSATDTQGDFTTDLYARSNFLKQYDKFGNSSTVISAGSPSLNGTINITDWTLHGDLMGADAPVDREIYFTNMFAGQIKAGDTINFTATDKKVFTPIGNYRLSHAGGGTFKLELVDYNPQVFRGQVTKLAQYENQLTINDMLFTHSMVLPSFKEEDGGMNRSMMANRYAGANDLYAPYEYSRKDGGVWFKGYGAFEHLDMKNGLDVGNNAYGSLVGADFGLKQLRNGWKFMPTAYVGYNGAHQYFNRVSAYQNGGQAGFMGTWYKDSFLLGALVYGGAYNNHMTVHNFSSEDSFGYFAGTALKSAYNWRIHKDFVIQPNLLASYNYFGQENWHTDFGQMSMMSGILNGVNIAPGVNFIWEKDTFNAYLTVQYMYNINQSIGGRAGNVYLPRMSMDHGYIQYGIGASKKFTDRFSGYIQAVLRNAGRTGVGLQAGFEISLGKK